MNKVFVGFGFGPIQSALFLYEAYRTNHFSRFVVAEVDQALVDAVRKNGGAYTVNIARKDRIDQFKLEGIELYNPRVEEDREKLIEAISLSDEMATALPSVDIFPLGGQTSVVSLLSQGLTRRTRCVPTVIYAAENNNHAAEILLDHLINATSVEKLNCLQVLNTVVGKMSGVITEPDEIAKLQLTTITPDIGRAVLVEEFNKILISRITLPNYKRGIDVFVEKKDLLPFEEAKLFGHNAIHALIAYLADLENLTTVADAGNDPWIMQTAKSAFIDESGKTLIRRHKKLKDPLFTDSGYRAYAEDLLERMVNPNLNDLVSRVGRDHVRKLGYTDRLYGTMHLALTYDVEPTNLALGAAAGVLSMIKRQAELTSPVESLPKNADQLTLPVLKGLLMNLWKNKTDEHAEKMIALTWQGLQQIRDRIAT